MDDRFGSTDDRTDFCFPAYSKELFLDDPNEALECPICFNVMKDPVLCPAEGHAFCRSCVLAHLQIGLQSCPICRCSLTKATLVTNRTARSLIDGSKLRCFSRAGKALESGDGCNWVGKVHESAAHYSECPFAVIPCPSNGCDKKMARKHLAQHITDGCRYGSLPCEDCAANVRVRDMEQHKKMLCPKRYVPCPNRCLTEPVSMTEEGNDNAVVLIRFDGISQHRAVCPEEVVECALVSAGCGVTLPRKDMKAHENEFGLHITGLMKTLKKTENTLESTIAKLNDTELRLMVSEKKLETTGRQLQASEAKVDAYASLLGVQDKAWAKTEIQFRFHVAALYEPQEADDFNVAGYTFSMLLKPSQQHPDYCAVFLRLKDGPRFPCETNYHFEVKRYNLEYPAINNFEVNHVFNGPKGRGQDRWALAETLRMPAYSRDQLVTILVKVSIKL